MKQRCNIKKVAGSSSSALSKTALLISLLILTDTGAQTTEAVLSWVHSDSTGFHFYNSPKNDTLRVELLQGESAAYTILFGWSRAGQYPRWENVITSADPVHHYAISEIPKTRDLYAWHYAGALKVATKEGAEKLRITYIAAAPRRPPAYAGPAPKTLRITDRPNRW